MIIRGHSLKRGGRKGSCRVLKAIQFKIAPAVIAPPVKKIIGVVIVESQSSKYWKDKELDEFHTTDNINRIEYLAVRIVAKRNRKRITVLVGLNKASSIIRSLE